MIITTSSKNAKIEYKKEAFTYPINTIAYAVDESYTSLTLFRNNERIGTSPLEAVVVDGQQATKDNVDELLSALFRLSGSDEGEGVTLPINISDVSELQEALDARPEDWVGTTFYVDGRYDKDDSTGSPLKPFKTIQAAHDAFAPISDIDELKIVYSPFPYYWGTDGTDGEQTLTFSKNITLWGSENTQQFSAMIGGIIITTGCNQCHLQNVQTLGIDVNNPLTSFTVDNLFVYSPELKITNAKYVFLRGLLYNNRNPKIIITNCENTHMRRCDHIAVELNKGTLTAYDCTFGYTDDSATAMDSLIVNNGAGVTALIGCNFAFYNIHQGKFLYHRIVNNANALIVAFDSVIGDANKAVPNVKYIDNSIDTSKFVQYDGDNNVNLIGKNNIILDKNKEVLGVASDESQHVLVKMGDYSANWKNLNQLVAGEELGERTIKFDTSYIPTISERNQSILIEFSTDYELHILMADYTPLIAEINKMSTGEQVHEFYNESKGGYVSDSYTFDMGTIISSTVAKQPESEAWADTIFIQSPFDQVEVGSETVHLNTNGSDRPTHETPDGKELYTFLSDLDNLLEKQNGEGTLFLADDDTYKEISQVPTQNANNDRFLYSNNSTPIWLDGLVQSQIDEGTQTVSRTISAKLLKANLDKKANVSDLSNYIIKDSPSGESQGSIRVVTDQGTIFTDEDSGGVNSARLMVDRYSSEFSINGEDGQSSIELAPDTIQIYTDQFLVNGKEVAIADQIDNYLIKNDPNSQGEVSVNTDNITFRSENEEFSNFAEFSLDSSSFRFEAHDGDDNTMIDAQGSELELSSNSLRFISNLNGIDSNVVISQGEIFISSSAADEGSADIILQGSEMSLRATDNVNFNSDVVIKRPNKILLQRPDGVQENAISLGVYGTYIQEEIGSEYDPTCINHNAKATDGTVVGKNIIVNYKDEDGVNQVDAIAYVTDLNSKASITGATSLMVLTQAEYDAIAVKDDNTIYFIKE